jgi:hypothetical protein
MADNEDLYGDEGMEPNKPTAEADPEDKGEEEDQGEDMGEQTALLPKSILAGKLFKVGDEVVLKITGMHENEIQVEYATEKSKSPQPGGDSDHSSNYE